ncbi:uncharacterized protein LOC107495193 isoform X1 [Arachis duranensis]|uniref:Uncharacterized protein LOC107495193 isoform X1 n=1 Tax=Arachis duranensis TaxID=130453 RepID=A0A6P4DPK4_ARADU|nr:uncharacterized protein LOC107495193 isoform X1 [Arachis duranensis]XP_015971786.1 uncharacterized protein LOC107495193 isoform X1 [Arachis duranensis]XP_052119246.1 uncharacterized protein LOC107495193 isoform X1 [Arachis duranensis]
MDSFSEDEECPFFDAISDGTDTPEANSSPNKDVVFNDFGYQVWIRSPPSVHERRINFMKWMGLNKDQVTLENSVDVDGMEGDIDMMEDSSPSVTTCSCFKEEFCSNRPSVSCLSRMDSSEEFNLVENMPCRDGKLESGVRWNLDPVGLYRERNDGGRNAGSDQRDVAEECEDSEYFFCVSKNFQHGKICKESKDIDALKQRSKRNNKGWFKRFGSMSCMVDRQGESDSRRHDGGCVFKGSNRIQKVKVRQCRKQTKELSALYMGQDIQAHRGSILTMKFSPDGRFLASAGEDGIVRLWKVVEDETCNEVDIPEVDPSCIYFTVNNLSELTPLFLEKEKLSKVKGLNKTSDSACIIFPPKVFRLLEKPLHEFHGHEGEILDLSWSNNNCLLSSSVDKTVRLWQVGHDFCLKVFPHSNYVTCIQFNPVDDNYFISGSIDGKVRIWEVPDCHVVDWTDIREIVTAVCYRPNGQGGIIGSMTGNCRFYTLSENHLQLDSQLCLLGKKKLPCRGITGFQFLPQDSNKVMVTCADSKVRILDGLNVVSKYEGLGAAGQMSASVTSDGKHILSACEDSNVYLWNVSDNESSSTKAKKIKSCERFFSNASVAVPWCGFESARQLDFFAKGSPQAMCLNPAASFSLSRDISSESLPKGSATWPEEKLPISSPKAKISSMHKSAYKFLKSSCKCTSNCHAWGLVILTAGWDGRIKSFHNYGLPVLV